jgi:hypothetical protein
MPTRKEPTMSKHMQEYRKYNRRVLKLMADLTKALRWHESWSGKVNPKTDVQYMVGDLVFVEQRLTEALRFVWPAFGQKGSTKTKGAKKEVMSFNRYQTITAKATRLLNRSMTPWRSLCEAATTFERQFKHVAMLIGWLQAEWQEQEFTHDAETTTETIWEIAGEMFRMKRQLILVFARVSNRHPREVVETLQEMEASEHYLSPPMAREVPDDED